MKRWGSICGLVCVAVVTTGCGGATPQGVTTPSAPSPSHTAAAAASAQPTPMTTSTAAAFPTEAFAAITDAAVSADLAAELQSILDDLAGGVGLSVGYTSLAGCLPDDGVVVVVLANRSADAVDVSAVAGSLVEMLRSP